MSTEKLGYGTVPDGCDFLPKKYFDTHAGIEIDYPASELEKKLAEKLKIAVEALQSIASEHKPRHIEKQYWERVGLEECAKVLATDTCIAREALLEIKGGGK